MNEHLTELYRQAYRQANPANPSTDIQYSNGSYYLFPGGVPGDGLLKPHSEAQLVEVVRELIGGPHG